MGGSFQALAAEPAAPIEELALAIAEEFRDVDSPAVHERLDSLGAEVTAMRAEVGPSGGPAGDAAALRAVLALRHGFTGRGISYEDPGASMIDVVLERGRGLPILLCAVWTAVAARAGVPLAGIGLPGHFVVMHRGADPLLVLDPFAGGGAVPAPAGVRPWSAQETALRMLNNLVTAFQARWDLGAAIRAAELRLALPASERESERMADEALGLRARLN